MVTNLGQQGREYLAKTTGKHLASLVTVTPRTGTGSLRFTDHDRALSRGSETFSPIGALHAGFERREGALRGGVAQGYGIIDGQNVVIEDVSGGKYSGANVVVQIIDWKTPRIQLSEQVFTISSIRWTAQSWIATLESLTASMRETKGGRFEGVFTARCPYVLGNEYCKKDLTSVVNIGVTVEAISSSRQAFTTVAARTQNAQSSGYFHEGEIEWLWAPPELESQLTTAASAGSNDLVDATQSWTDNEHAGKFVRILNGTGAFVLEYAEIASNTSDTLIVYGTGWESTHAIGVFYDICDSSELRGVVSPISSYTLSTRAYELFFPTPRGITVGHSGIVRPGCDGLSSTCKDKFNNILNFGGLDVNAPTPADIIRPPEDN